MRVVLNLQFGWQDPRSVGEALLLSELDDYRSHVADTIRSTGTTVIDVASAHELEAMISLYVGAVEIVELLATPIQAVKLAQYQHLISVVESRPYQFLAWSGTFDDPYEDWLKGISLATKIYAPAVLTGGSTVFAPQYRTDNIEIVTWSASMVGLAPEKSSIPTKVREDVAISSEWGPFDSTLAIANSAWSRAVVELERSAQITWSLGQGGQGLVWPVGFFPAEHWGIWAEEEFSTVLLPKMARGLVRFDLALIGCGVNVGSEVEIRFSSQTRRIVLSASLTVHTVYFDVTEHCDRLEFAGYELDTTVDKRGLGLGVASISMRRFEPWNGENQTWHVAPALSEGALTSFGFHDPESWGGVWSSDETASVELPETFTGKVNIDLTAKGCGRSIGREVLVTIGEETRQLVLGEEFQSHRLAFDLPVATCSISFSNLAVDHDVDQRGLGIGLLTIHVQRARSLFGKVLSRCVRDRRPPGRKDGDLIGVDSKMAVTPLEPWSRFEIRAVAWIRATDLLHDDWLELVKGFVEAFRDSDVSRIVVLCPSAWATRLMPEVVLLMSRVQPHKCAVRFVFVSDNPKSWKRYLDESNVVVYPRPDDAEKELETLAKWMRDDQVHVVKIASRVYSTELVRWERSPLLLQSSHLVDELVRGLLLSRKMLLANPRIGTVRIVATTRSQNDGSYS